MHSDIPNSKSKQSKYNYNINCVYIRVKYRSDLGTDTASLRNVEVRTHLCFPCPSLAALSAKGAMIDSLASSKRATRLEYKESGVHSHSLAQSRILP